MNPGDFTRRADLIEEMDRADSPEDRLFRTLDQFETLNRLVSRSRGILTSTVLADLKQDPGQPRHLADLGAGGCDISRWLVRRARRLGATLRITAIERDERIIRHAAGANAGYPEIRIVHADLFDQEAWGNPDYVFANHVLHHFPDPKCVDLLRLLDRAGLRRYLVSDLIRSVWSARAFRVGFSPFFHGSFLIQDGVTSIRRGFTIPEVRELLHRAAPLHPSTVRRVFPGRFIIEGGPAKT